MAKKIIWSARAIAGFDKIIRYLEKEWTKKEIEKLLINTQKFYDKLNQDQKIQKLLQK